MTYLFFVHKIIDCSSYAFNLFNSLDTDKKGYLTFEVQKKNSDILQ